MGHHGVHRFCIAKNAEKHSAIRLKIPDMTIEFHDQFQGHFLQALGTDVGDMIIKRADDFRAYQLAVVVDDADQNITHIVRGQDLISSTPKKIYLQRTLGFATPQYAQLPLVLDDKGQKLSKSLAACPIDPRDPIPTLRRAWQYLGQSPISWPCEHNPEHAIFHAIQRFDAGKIPASSQLLTT